MVCRQAECVYEETQSVGGWVGGREGRGGEGGC